MANSRKQRSTARPHHLVTERDLVYLRSIQGNLDDLKQILMDRVEAIGYCAVANEALEDNRDWLNCFIARFSSTSRLS